MRHASLLAVALLGLSPILVASDARAASTGQINLFAGQRSLDQDFEPADDADQFGVAFTLGHDRWPLALAVDLMLSSSDGSRASTLGGFPVVGDADVDINELNIGVRRFVGAGAWRGYFGGGAAFVEAEFESTIRDDLGTLFSAEDDDSDLGLWLNVGGTWLFAERFQAGVDVRYTDAEVEFLDGQSFDAGAVQFGVTVGYRW